MLSNNVETLKNMSASAGKYAKWHVRVIDPKVKDYSFQSRGETAQAKKFERVLASQGPSQHMMGLAPSEFKDRQAANQAATKFPSNSAREVTTPAFDAKAKPEFNGCPVKAVLLLKAPAQLKEVAAEFQAACAHPACGLHVALDIRGIAQALQRAGAAMRSSKH